jgi:hypothetical protein
MAMLAVLIAACAGTSAPVATAAGMDEVVANLVTRGVTVHRHVSGDAGCPESGLHDNALRIDVSLSGQPDEYAVYLFRWRRDSDFVAASADFAACVASFSAANQGSGVSTIELPPWRAYGPDWSPQIEQVVRDAIQASGG